MTPERQQILKGVMALLGSDVLNKKDFSLAFKTLMDFVKQTRQMSDTEIKELKGDIKEAIGELKAGNEDNFSTLKEQILAKVASLKDGAKGDKGDTGIQGGQGLQGDKGEQGMAGKDGSPDSPTQVRDKLESIKTENDKLMIEAIKGLRKELDDLKAQGGKRTLGGAGWGAHPLVVSSSGTVKTKVARVLNFTGATVTHNADGTTTVAVVGGSSSTLIATGAKNNSNLVFTFPSAPTQVNVNGLYYIDGHGCSISGTTVTLDAPVGADGWIFGLG